VPGHRLGNPGSGPNRACHTEAHTDTSDAAFQNDGQCMGDFARALVFLPLLGSIRSKTPWLSTAKAKQHQCQSNAHNQ